MPARAYRGCSTRARWPRLLLGGLALLVTVDVLARNLGWGTLPWILEVTEYCLPLTTLLALRGCSRRRARPASTSCSHDPPSPCLRPRARGRPGRLSWCRLAIVVYGLKASSTAPFDGAVVMKCLRVPRVVAALPVPVSFGLLAFEVLFRMQRLYAGERGRDRCGQHRLAARGRVAA